jgi:DNA-directed RNA polymerase specialized sigma24 family protein
VRGHAGGSAAGAPRALAWSQVPDEATSVSRRVARDELLRGFLDRLAMLSDDDRRLFLYRGLEGLSHEDVAERLASAPGAVRKRWERLRTRLVALGLPAALGAAD